MYEKTKNDPRSFSHTLKNQDLKKNITSIREGYEIFKIARKNGEVEVDDQSMLNDEIANIKYEVLRTGYSEFLADCNDEVNIEYILISTNGNIANKSIIKIVIGEGFNEILEKVSIGMRPGEIRMVNIPKTFLTGDKKYDNYIQTRNMQYQITMLEINKTIGNNYVCK